MTNRSDASRTHFGYREVPEDVKSGLVSGVFQSVASRYDLMNDLMSFGIHRMWKDFAVGRAAVTEGDRVLDVAAGTCDLAWRMAGRVGKRGRVVVSDINPSMLSIGRERLEDRGVTGNVDFVIADAENLPFQESIFDCITIAFGLRNVTRIDRALESMCGLVKPGGSLMVLEFSKPVSPILDKLYHRYSFSIIPEVGKLVTGDRDSYQYLVESIQRHPDQETLANMMTTAGFEDVVWHNLAGGIVAVHHGRCY